MPRLLVGNFEFEHRLSGRGGALSAAVRRIDEELACTWIVAAEEGDRLWLPVPVEQAFFAQAAAGGLPRVVPVHDEASMAGPVDVCPWGWTDPLRRWADRHGWRSAAPPQEAVRAVNSRRFSWELEQAWGVSPAGAATCRSVEEFLAAVESLASAGLRWVVKAEFGMSARERLLGRGRPDPAATNWVRKRLRADGVVFLEPWLDRLEEAGLQFTIPPDGPPFLEGITPLWTDPAGAYRGSDFTPDPHLPGHWREAVEIARRAAERMQAAGYFGPAGFDAMRYRDAAGDVRLRPLQDINARHTMGRLSLGLRRLLRPGEQGVWRHVHWGSEAQPLRRWFDALCAGLPPDTRILRTSPFEAGGRPTRLGSFALFTRSE